MESTGLQSSQARLGQSVLPNPPQSSPILMATPGTHLQVASRETHKGLGPNTCLPNLSTGLVLLLLAMLLAVFPEEDPVSADC